MRGTASGSRARPTGAGRSARCTSSRRFARIPRRAAPAARRSSRSRTKRRRASAPTRRSSRRRAESTIVYDDVGANGTPDVFVTALDRALRPLFRAQVNPPDRGKTQQLFPAAAVDSSTGTLWACWYDTTFDPNAHRAWYTCSASHDGRTWTPPERAAAAPTKVADLFTDLQNSTGLSTTVVADRGIAHAFWINIGEVDFAQDIYTAALSERAAFLTLRR